jgi:hypothetical protein
MAIILPIFFAIIFMAGVAFDIYINKKESDTEWSKICAQKSKERLEKAEKEFEELGALTNTSGDYCVGFGTETLNNNNLYIGHSLH